MYDDHYTDNISTLKFMHFSFLFSKDSLPKSYACRTANTKQMRGKIKNQECTYVHIN
jgi:hypothetical protein